MPATPVSSTAKAQPEPDLAGSRASRLPASTIAFFALPVLPVGFVMSLTDVYFVKFGTDVLLYMLKEYYPARNAFRRAFALSNGESKMAERNLNRVEATIAQIEEIPATNPAISHDVIRLGTSEFRLIETASREADVMAE